MLLRIGVLSPRCKQALPRPPSRRREGGAPKGASIHSPRRICHPQMPRARQRIQRDALAFRRSTAALAGQLNATGLSPGRASRSRCTKALPSPPTTLKRSTSRAARSSGGVDARTAREQGYEPRPQEPHPPHQPAVTGRRPFEGGLMVYVSISGTYVNISVTTIFLFVMAGLDPAIHAGVWV